MLLHKSGVSAEDMVVDVGIFFLYAFRGARKYPDHIGLARADIDVAGNHLIGQCYLAFGHPDQLQDLLRPLAQEHPFLSQQHLSGTLCAADQKLFSQFLLQGLQLGGKGWLRNVQRLRRGRNVLLSGHCQKILQYSQLHHHRLLSKTIPYICIGFNYAGVLFISI